MKKTYDDWMNIARIHREALDNALTTNRAQDILYYRGKYLYDLKQANNLNPSGIVKSEVSGTSVSVPVTTLIQSVYSEHSNFINKELATNKKNSSHEDATLSKEFGLKLRRLSNHVSQANFATGATQKRDNVKEIAKDSLGLAGTVLKTPFMLSARVMSLVGPLTVNILFLPLKFVSSIVSITAASVFEMRQKDEYDHKILDSMSDGLGKAITYVSNKAYDKLGSL